MKLHTSYIIRNLIVVLNVVILVVVVGPCA